MDNKSSNEVTRLLSEIGNGNQNAVEKLLPLVYKELRQLASRYLSAEFQKRTIQTTELVHEAYLKLVGQENLNLQNRNHFFGVAANSMRQILVDYARKRNAVKRGKGVVKISLEDAAFLTDEKSEEIVQLDESLKRLEAFDKRLSQIVEMRFFAGMTIEETAEVLNISPSTVKREWNLAKAWLYKEMGHA
jgi:RNA polymerase sigma factor (TIGR02999 family)